MRSGHYIISVSLGAAAKPSGLVVIEPKSKYFYPKGDESRLEWDNHFDVVHLERLPAGEPYPAIVARVRELAAARRLSRGCDVLVDITIPGAAPLRLFQDAGLYTQPFEVTNATDAHYQDGIQHLPQRDMIGAAQVALQSDRLKFASELELAPSLVTDLTALDPTLPGLVAKTGQITDLVTAVATAVWWGDRLQWNEEVADRMLPDDDEPADVGRSTIGGY